MDILGVGFPELVFIFIIAMMVFGPRRLPEIAAKAGKTIRDLRNMSQGLMTEWQREITVAARLEELEEARQGLEEAKRELQQAQKTIAAETLSPLKTARNEINEVKKELQQPKTTPPPEASSEKESAVKPTSVSPSSPASAISPIEVGSE